MANITKFSFYVFKYLTIVPNHLAILYIEFNLYIPDWSKQEELGVAATTKRIMSIIIW